MIQGNSVVPAKAGTSNLETEGFFPQAGTSVKLSTPRILSRSKDAPLCEKPYRTLIPAASRSKHPSTKSSRSCRSKSFRTRRLGVRGNSSLTST